jgi:hypothetical protein
MLFQWLEVRVNMVAALSHATSRGGPVNRGDRSWPVEGHGTNTHFLPDTEIMRTLDYRKQGTGATLPLDGFPDAQPDHSFP